MDPEGLPTFRYHPDPIATGSITSSDEACIICRDRRGFAYVGPTYSAEEVEGSICPWCIADGSAAERLDAEFTDIGSGVPDDVPGDVIGSIATRTPGFSGWQQERWLYHCGDGAAFLGRAGFEELQSYGDALEMLRTEAGRYLDDDADVDEHVQGLKSDGSATAYLFRCLHCSRHLAYSDMA